MLILFILFVLLLSQSNSFLFYQGNVGLEGVWRHLHNVTLQVWGGFKPAVFLVSVNIP